MIALYFAAALLGVYRVVRMFLLEDGPFDIFSSIQARITQKTWVGRGLTCFLCLSFWLSLPAAALIAADWRQLLLLWFGIAGGNVVLWKWLVATGIEGQAQE